MQIKRRPDFAMKKQYAFVQILNGFNTQHGTVRTSQKNISFSKIFNYFPVEDLRLDMYLDQLHSLTYIIYYNRY